jgi:hypothetical protein
LEEAKELKEETEEKGRRQEAVEALRQTEHKRRFDDALRLKNEQLNLKQKEYDQLLKVEQAKVDVSMKDAVQVAMQRLEARAKRPREDTSEDSSSDDDDVVDFRNKNQKDNLDFLTQIGIFQTKDNVKRTQKLKKIKKMIQGTVGRKLLILLLSQINYILKKFNCW